jgi:glucosamine--fructose-6-phosphate aminotransferase (isomerizing)
MPERVIRGPYLADLLLQPTAVEATLAGLAMDDGIEAPRFGRVVLTGMGSSLSALHPLAIRLVEHGITAIVIDTSELIHSMQGLLDATTLVVAVSQSGRSAEIVRLVEDARGATILGVTNTADSPLARRANTVVLTHAGEESTVSCKTYVAALVALDFVGDHLCRERATTAAVVPIMRAYLERWEEHVAELMSLTLGTRDIFFAGRGGSLAAAHTAGLIVKESTRLHAEGMTSAALRHGPLEMAADHVFALVYEGHPRVAELNAGLVADLRRAGARAELVSATSSRPSLRVPSIPALEILPAQMLSLALAAHAGIEAGRFAHATKVTATE